MATFVAKSAEVHPAAQLEDGVHVGPFCVVGPQVVLGPGTLYRSIGHLVDSGLIEETSQSSTAEDQRRRFYRITPDGRLAARQEAKRLSRLVHQANQKKILGDEETLP